VQMYPLNGETKDSNAESKFEGDEHGDVGDESNNRSDDAWDANVERSDQLAQAQIDLGNQDEVDGVHREFKEDCDDGQEDADEELSDDTDFNSCGDIEGSELDISSNSNVHSGHKVSNDGSEITGNSKDSVDFTDNHVDIGLESRKNGHNRVVSIADGELLGSYGRRLADKEAKGEEGEEEGDDASGDHFVRGWLGGWKERLRD